MIPVYKFDNVLLEMGLGRFATLDNYYKATEMYENDFNTCLSFENYVIKHIDSIIN